MSMKVVLFGLIVVFGTLLAVAYYIYSAYIDLTYDDFKKFVIIHVVNGALGFVIIASVPVYLMCIQMKQLEHYKLNKFIYFMLHYAFSHIILFIVAYGWDTTGTWSYFTSPKNRIFAMIMFHVSVPVYLMCSICHDLFHYNYCTFRLWTSLLAKENKRV